MVKGTCHPSYGGGCRWYCSINLTQANKQVEKKKNRVQKVPNVHWFNRTFSLMIVQCKFNANHTLSFACTLGAVAHAYNPRFWKLEIGKIMI
jgi:hypothetical protein